MINIDKFKEIRVLVIGDIMLDEYIFGDVKRISPEAPVPIVSLKKRINTLGGAGNVINNLYSLGAKVDVVGILGMDSASSIIHEKFSEMNIDTFGLICTTNRPTTIKTRVISCNQHLIRIDEELTNEIDYKFYQKMIDRIESRISFADIVIISDYNKGVISKELVRKIIELAKTQNILVLADPKSDDFLKYQNVDIITPNLKETEIAYGKKIINIVDTARWLCGVKLKTKRLLITCGKDGMVLFEDNKINIIKSKTKQVFDVSGAGDTVITLLALGLASGNSFKKSAILANEAAGIVVGKLGTSVVTVDELKENYK